MQIPKSEDQQLGLLESLGFYLDYVCYSPNLSKSSEKRTQKHFFPPPGLLSRPHIFKPSDASAPHMPRSWWGIPP